VLCRGISTMNTFLALEEIRQLTGYTKPTYQKKWLVDNGFSFEVRCDGHPVVGRAYYEGRSNRNYAKRPSVPDLAALDKLE